MSRTKSLAELHDRLTKYRENRGDNFLLTALAGCGVRENDLERIEVAEWTPESAREYADLIELADFYEDHTWDDGFDDLPRGATRALLAMCDRYAKEIADHAGH